MFFKQNFLKLTLLPLLVLAISASFYRFFILKDYDVLYEVECDPYTESCYVWCEDDECLEPFYYNYITKSAGDLLPYCGLDITDCEESYYCLESDEVCEMEFCDSNFDECDELSESDINYEDVQENSSDLSEMNFLFEENDDNEIDI